MLPYCFFCFFDNLVRGLAWAILLSFWLLLKARYNSPKMATALATFLLLGVN
jgi:hypothetical protein